MSKLKDIVHVTFSQGGMLESIRTGVYPQYLDFYSEIQCKSWRHKVKGDSKKGTLKSGGNLLYSYNFTNEGCEVLDSNGNKVEVLMTHIMCD